MKFAELLDVLGDAPVFTSSMLRVGGVDSADVASQLSRWVASGKLLRLRREVYAVADPYRRRDPHAFEIANTLVRPSYVSLESALAFHGLIPEAVLTHTSVTTARLGTWSTPLGAFAYRHLGAQLFWGYSLQRLSGERSTSALVALPEKALLDLVYLRPQSQTLPFLRQLRLERLERLDLERLHHFARKTGKPKLLRAAQLVARMTLEQADEWEVL